MKRSIRLWTMTVPMVPAHPAMPNSVATELAWQAVHEWQFLASPGANHDVGTPGQAIVLPGGILGMDPDRSVSTVSLCQT